MAEPTYEPELPWVLWGDGGTGRYLDARPIEEDVEGVKLQPLLVAPSRELIAKANIKPEELTENLHGYPGLWVKYPVKHVDWLDHSPVGGALFIWCGFRGEETVVTMKMGALMDWDRIRDQREHQLQTHVAFLMEKLKISTAQMEAVMMNVKHVEDMVAGQRVEQEGEGDG